MIYYRKANKVDYTLNMNNEHFRYLKNSYSKVGNETWLNSDFIQSNLDTSINLFTKKSLKLQKPKPKNLEVYALLSGLSFSEKLCDKLMNFQKYISDIITDKLHYWVIPKNFGVEYCVFKWPDEKWDKSQSQIILNELSALQSPHFKLIVEGIQINRDGCVIAKGFDDEGIIFKIRKHLKNKIPFLPNRQSGWAHIPLGRILEPIGKKNFDELRQFINKHSDDFIFSEKINKIKFVHETRWYMEEKSIISEFLLK
tara:strand:+ start:2337 stop:3101 length:765 start_codon:yes stop_codon:yes gene_type:complete